MIGIKIKGDTEFLEMAPDAALTLRLENPILGDPDKLSPGSYSYDFDIPSGDVSQKNAAKLKNPDVVENSEAYTLQKADLFFDSVPMRSGNLRTTNAKKNIASSYFTFGLNSISEDFKKAKLRSVVDENVVIGSSDIVKKVYLKKLSAGDYNIILNGQSYVYPDTPTGRVDLSVATAADAFTKTLDNADAWAPKVTIGVSASPGGITTPYLIINLIQSYTISVGVFGERECKDPLIELHVELGDGIDPADYKVESNIGTYYSEFQTYLTSFLNAGTYPNNKVRFPVVFNDDLYGEVLKDGSGINLVNAAGFIQNDPNFGLTNTLPFQIKNYNSIQPFLLLKYVLDRIAFIYGFTWTGDFYNDPEVANILLWNSAPLDLPQNYIGSKKFVFWKRSYNYNELIADISVIDFLKALQSRYNLAVFFNENLNQAQISYREPIAKSHNYEDITPISSPINSFESSRVTGFAFTVAADTTDLYSVKEQLIVGDKAEDTIEINCGRLFKTGNTLVSGQLESGPLVKQKQGENGMLRVFHYTGIVAVTGFSYASAAISGGTINEVLLNLYEDYHQLWLIFQKNRLLVRLDVQYPLRSLLNYDFELKRRFDRNNYLVKSIEVTLRNTGVGVSAIELMTMR